MNQRSTLKKVFIYTSYLLIGILLTISIFLLIQKTSSKENGKIVQAQDSSTYFRNENPKFNVDFVDGEYVRFESIKSYKNPFEERKESLWEKIKELFGIDSKKLGLELRLESISYDETISNIAGEEFENLELKRSIELIQSGKDIYQEESEVVSKDTIASRGIYKGIDIEYQIVEGKGLKEEIVLQELPEYTSECSQEKCTLPANRYVFSITLDEGLKLKRSITSLPGFPSGTQYITDEQGNYFAHFLPEYAIDALGNKTSNVYVDISEGDKQNEYIYELVLDANWLLSQERLFPIRIDPSIVHDSTLSFDLGVYDRAVVDQTSSIRLDSYLSGEYLSGSLPLGGSTVLESIYLSALGSATGDRNTPFSTFGILKQDLERLEVGGNTQPKTINITSSTNSYFAIELWKYQRFKSANTEEYIFKSNLGDLITDNGKYAFKNSNGEIFESNLEVQYNKLNHTVVVFDLNSNQIHLYIDGLEERIPVVYATATTLSQVILGSTPSMFGYIEMIRVYDRLLTSYEVISNSQYANLYLTYRSSIDGIEWNDWIYASKNKPVIEQKHKGIYITTDSNDLSSYDLLTFLYKGHTQENISISKSPIEAGLETENTHILQNIQNQYSMESVKYIDFWFKPETNTYSCLLNIDNLSIYTLENGKISVQSEGSNISTEDSYIPNIDNHIAIKIEGSESSVYLNGNKSNSSLAETFSNEGLYSVGSGCIHTEAVADSSVSNLRVSQEENIDVYSVFSVEDREYIFKPVFTAKLHNPSSFSSVESRSIYVREENITTSNYVQNLNIGDTISIEEVIGDKVYILEGEVITVNKDTGLVEVKEWSGEFPTEGLTENANVYKWQREYIPLKKYIASQENLTTLFLSGEDNLEVREVELISPVKESEYASYFGNVESPYLQYKVIFTSKMTYLTPYLSGVNINYSSAGPAMDQIMRHGKWFNNGEKQPFWWTKGLN